MDMPILEVKGALKMFGGHAAVNKVDFEVEKGEIMGLIGPNGAGKTTFFNLISGFYKPDGGSIKFEGHEIAGQSPNKICRLGIGRTFQAAKNFPGMSLFQNVKMGAAFGKKGRAHTDKEVEEIIEFVGIKDHRSKRVSDLTLAENKRLETARAIATRPTLLMLDEMMAGLNPSEIDEVMALVRRIRESGITVIMIEHVMKAIMNTCDRITCLHHGEKIAFGTPDEIANDKAVIEVYLGKSD